LNARYFRPVGTTAYGQECIDDSVQLRVTTVGTYRPKNQVGVFLIGDYRPANQIS
jgi:hypothetical protein